MKDNSTHRAITPETVYEILRAVIDPEIGVNIVDLGLVYEVVVEDGRVAVTMTLTSPACPMGAHLADESRQAIEAAVGPAVEVDLQLAWEPAWSPEMMSDEARRLLGWQ